jgi:hypothetical protein
MTNKSITIAAAVVVVVAALSFYGGILTEKSLSHSTANQTASGGSGQYGSGGGGFGGGGGGGFRQGGGVFGTVQSVSGTTMVVSDQRTGSNTTVSLASNPTITSGSGSSATVSDIQTGDTVIVRGSAGSDGTVTAQSVRINPSFGGSGDGGDAGSTSNGT